MSVRNRLERDWPKRFVVCLWTLTAALAVLAAPAAGRSQDAEARIALVIGNGAYQEWPLKNPPNDARLIATTLRGLGFTLVGSKGGQPLIDADQKAMKRAIQSFGEALDRAGSSAVGLFYYAGHGVQASGRNYLIPIGTDIRREADLEIEAVFADWVLAQMEYSRSRVSLVILDACRNNPYQRQFRSTTRGLAEMRARRIGSLIAYATAPGEVAEDGLGANSPYATALAEAMVTPNLLVEQTFKRVRGTVMDTTGDRQIPWESSSLRGDFYFAQKALVPPPAQQPAETLPASPAVTPRVGATFRDCDGCPEMVVVPAGKFTMGSPKDEVGRSSSEGPQHRVTTAPFAMGKTEVTFAQWDACVAAGGCNGYRPDDRWGRGSQPVINVSWKDAKAYVSWLSKQTGKPYRLPTEAEWEYAARAGTMTPFSSGATISTAQANYDGNYTYGRGSKGKYRGKTVPAGSLPANPWGLYEVHGNIWEWVEDVWHENYEGAPTDGAAWTDGEGKESSRFRVLRGGSWNFYPRYLRSANRIWDPPDYRDNYIGFRVARTLD